MMSVCQSCRDLQGRSSFETQQHRLTLAGVGALSGTIAVEHYRCPGCGSSIFRILAGEPTGRIWHTPDFGMNP